MPDSALGGSRRAPAALGGMRAAEACDGELLVADYGGTHARFASVAANGEIQRIAVLACSDFSDPLSAARAYLERYPMRPRRACFAVAGPVRDGAVDMTRLDWRLEAETMQAELDVADGVLLLNDCEAIALSVPMLRAGQRVQIGPGEPQAGAPACVLAAGTGLGVSAFLPMPGWPATLPTEGGHAGIAPDTPLEFALFEDFARRGIPCLRESFLSGVGITRIHESMQRIRGEDPTQLKPGDVAAQALSAPESTAAQSMETFCELLGSAASDQALCMGARGGVYLAGGVTRKLRDFVVNSGFRRRFEQKDAMRDWLRQVPTYLITDPHPGLIGAAAAAR